MFFINVKDIPSSQQFNQLVKQKPTLTFFYSPNCGYCVELEPEWNALENILKKQYQGNMMVARIHQDMINDLQCDKDIKGFPTIFVLKNGKKKKEYTGERKHMDLLKFIKKNFSIKPIRRKKSLHGGSSRRRRRRRHKTRTKRGGRRQRRVKRTRTFRKRKR
jgi:protein disulfide-isomerase/protein disulfide-isomerase A6